ncbi:hypothetical protein [Pleionea sp. CnH1-48]|uniref:hypothetical protein n=1 Tax=Pleionea sp. CnH1-48 TaxID=2954494 RepID=UPI0020968B4F|nr:hypothetical protein [Pleionea sp. CnH1-48]MCO7227001.1 hypothetical protein [Pleionea sp. CnH1-48]
MALSSSDIKEVSKNIMTVFITTQMLDEWVSDMKGQLPALKKALVNLHRESELSGQDIEDIAEARQVIAQNLEKISSLVAQQPTDEQPKTTKRKKKQRQFI